MKSLMYKNAGYIAFATSLVATLASLYFSEIAGFTPCILCWYQRIAMYPLVVITAVGVMQRDRNLPYYALPFSISGGIIALYHYLLQRGIIPDELAPCSLGVSCTDKYIEYLGFITIPFMSLIAFVIIGACMIILVKTRKGAA